MANPEILDTERFDIFVLLRALNQIDGEDYTGGDTPNILNSTIRYTSELLKAVKGREPAYKYLRSKENRQESGWMKTVFNLGFNVSIVLDTLGGNNLREPQIKKLSAKRKRQLVVIIYYIKGKISSPRDFDYVEQILLSIREDISDFRAW